MQTLIEQLNQIHDRIKKIDEIDIENIVRQNSQVKDSIKNIISDLYMDLYINDEMVLSTDFYNDFIRITRAELVRIYNNLQTEYNKEINLDIDLYDNRRLIGAEKISNRKGDNK